MVFLVPSFSKNLFNDVLQEELGGKFGIWWFYHTLQRDYLLLDDMTKNGEHVLSSMTFSFTERGSVVDHMRMNKSFDLYCLTQEVYFSTHTETIKGSYGC